MRPLYLLSMAALLLIAGIWPSAAEAIGHFLASTVGLLGVGARELLAQPAVFGLAVTGLLIHAYRTRSAH